MEGDNISSGPTVLGLRPDKECVGVGLQTQITVIRMREIREIRERRKTES